MESQNLVVEIQVVLPRVESEDPKRLEDLARRYAAACEGANERLVRAVGYLRRGYRSEAIRICEAEPMLLQEVNTLSFSQRRDWLHIAEQVHVVTPELIMAMATELTDSYDLYGATKELAAKNREQCLRGAPREQRRSTLEALCQADPQNATWRKNLEDLDRD
ncbi:MAG: hypothetical protein NXI22_02565 [bacterium]|nr:hypothetical protein [bacterium]